LVPIRCGELLADGRHLAVERAELGHDDYCVAADVLVSECLDVVTDHLLGGVECA
jgi:hypothetical protein